MIALVTSQRQGEQNNGNNLGVIADQIGLGPHPTGKFPIGYFSSESKPQPPRPARPLWLHPRHVLHFIQNVDVKDKVLLFYYFDVIRLYLSHMSAVNSGVRTRNSIRIAGGVMRKFSFITKRELNR